MAAYLPLPDGSSVTIRPGETPADAWARAQRDYPDAFVRQEEEFLSPRAVAPEAPAEPKRGIGAALRGGLERMGSTARTAAESLFDAEEAAARGLERGEKISEQYAPGADWSRVTQAYREKGLLPAAGEVLSQIPAAVAEQVPQIGATMAGAKLGAMAGTAVAPGLGTVIGGGLGALAPSLLQLYGSNVERQAEAQQEAGKPIDISRTAALGAAVPGAALEAAATLIPFGRAAVGKILGPDAARYLASATGREIVEESLKRTLLKGAGVGTLAEIPTEITQQMLERLQAGLPLTSDEALAEYGQAAYGAALVGAPVGSVGRAYQRSVAQGEKQAEDEAKAKAQAEKTRAEEAARMESPEYIADVERQYEQLRAEIAKAQRLKKPELPKDATPEQELAHEEALAAYEEQRAAQKDLAARYRTARDAYKQALPLIQKQRARYQDIETEAARTQPAVGKAETFIDGEAPQPTGDEAAVLAAERDRRMYGPESQQALFEGLFDQADQRDQLRAAEEIETPEMQRVRLMSEIRGIDDQLNQLRERAQGATTAAELQQLAQREQELYNYQKQANEQLGQLPEPVDFKALERNLKKLTKAVADAKDEGDIAKAAKAQTQLEALQEQLAQSRFAERDMRDAGGVSESVDEFNQRVVGPEIAAAREARAAEEAQRQAVVGPEAEALQRIGQREDLTPYVRQVKQELGTRREIEAMEQQAAMDRGRTVQGELFAERPTERITPSRVTPEALGNLLQRAQNSPRLTPEDAALIEQVQAEMPAMTASPDRQRIDVVADWAYRAATGNPSPERRAEVQGLVQQLQQGRLSETERLTEAQQRAMTKEEKRALQGLTPGTKPGPVTSMTNRRGVMERAPTGEERRAAQPQLPGVEPIATEFESWQEFENYLAGTALAQIRDSMGLEGDTAARQMRNMEGLANRVNELRAQIAQVTKQRDAALAAAEPDRKAASQMVQQSEAALYDLQKKLDAEMTGLQIRYLESARKLADSQRQVADVAQQISDNVALLEQQITAYEAQVGGRDKAVERLRAAQAELKTAVDAQAADKQAMATALDNIANGLPFDTNNKAFGEARMRVLNRKGDLVAVHQRLMQANAAIPAMPRLSSTVFRDFLLEDTKLQQTLSAEQSRLGGMVSARNRAKAALDAAFQAQQADPAVIKALADATSDVEIAQQLQAAVQQGIDLEVQPLDARLRQLGSMAEPLIRRIEQLQRGITKTAEKRVSEQQRAVEQQRKQAEEAKREEARAEREKRAQIVGGETTAPRERVTFKRDVDKMLNSGQYKALEDLAANPDAPLDDRRRAMNTLTDWLLGVDRKANVFANQTARMIEEQLERIDALRQLKQDKPGQVKKIAEREAVIKRAVESLRKRAGAIRTPVATPAELKAASDKLLRETRDLPLSEEEQAELAKQPKGRAIGPAAKRETIAPSQLRTASPESRAGENKLSPRNPIAEARGEPQRNTAISDKEMAEANRLAEELRKKTPEQKQADVAAAENTVKKLREAKPKKEPVPKTPKTRVQKVFEDIAEMDTDEMDFGGLDIPMGDALFSEIRDGNVYETRAETELNPATVEAARDGRIIEVVERLQSDGSTPFVRELAKRLRPLIMRTKLRVQDGVVDADGKFVEGTYDPETNTVQIDRLSMSEETLTHELTHAVTLNTLQADPATLTPEQQQARAELEALFKQIQKESAFQREYAKKNIAEFVSELMSNPQVRTKLDQRNFLQRIYDAILRMIGMAPTQTRSERAVENAYKLFAPSRMSQGARVASVLRGVFPGSAPKFAANVPESLRKMASPSPQRRAVGQQVSAAALGFRTLALDRWAPVEYLTKLGVAKGLITETQAQQARIHMRLHEDTNRFTATSLMNGVVQLQEENGKRFYGGKPSEANIRNVVAQVNEAGIGDSTASLDMWQKWMQILRADRLGRGYDVLNIAKPPTVAEAKELKDFVQNNPKVKAAFEKARETYKQYNRDLMRAMTEAGTLPKDIAAQLADADYIPYYRIDGTNVVMDGVASKPFQIGSLLDNPSLKELVGGSQEMLPVLDAIVQNTSLITRINIRNLQAKDTANLLRDMGLGKIVQSDNPPANVLRFKHNGKNYWIDFDRDAFPEGVTPELVLQGMQGIKTTVPTMLKFMGIPTQILRAGITRMPMYVIRQMIRDPLFAWITTGAKFTPVVSSIKELTKIRRGLSPTEEALQRSGAISSMVQTGDYQDTARMIRDIGAGKKGWNAAMMAIDNFAMQADASTRAVLYDAYRKQGMDHVDAMLGAAESMNFSRRGTSSSLYSLSTLIPFFNAQLQGIDAMYRAIKGDTIYQKRMGVRNTLIKRGLLMTAMTLAYAAAMEDDEAYKNATPQERAMNWFVYLPGVEDPVRVPIPFEPGLIFKAIPEAVVNAMFGDDTAKDAVAAIRAQLWASTPLQLPTAINPIVELATNYSFFTDRPIESAREMGVDKAERYRPQTTELAKLLGNSQLSPIQIEHLVRGYTGSAGILLMSMLNYPLRPLISGDMPEKAEATLSQTPLFGPAFQPRDGRGAIDAVYKDVERFQRASDTFEKLVEEGRGADARAYASEFATEIAMASTGGAFRQQMGELAQMRRAVMASSLTPAEKRERLDEIRQVEIRLAQQVRTMSRGTSE